MRLTKFHEVRDEHVVLMYALAGPFVMVPDEAPDEDG